MTDTAYAVDTDRFARCIDASKRVRWDIETDVIRGRSFDTAQKFRRLAPQHHLTGTRPAAR